MSFNPLKLMQLKTGMAKLRHAPSQVPVVLENGLQTGTGGRNRSGIQGHYAGWQGADF